MCVGFPPDTVKLAETGGFRWVCTACSEINENLGGSSIERKLDQIINNLGLISKRQEDFVASLNFYGDKLQDLENQMKSFGDLKKNVSDLSASVEWLKDENMKLKRELHELQQQTKMRDLEIVGIPEAKNENITKIVQQVSSMLSFPNIEACVENVYRVHSSPKDKKSRPIVVSFKNKVYRNEFMKAYKGSKNLKAADFGFNQTESKVYVDESLSTFNRSLFYMARQFAKSNNFKFCWIQDCKILLRKDEKSKIFHVTSSEQLENLN